jgi:hypothetical protein
VQASLLKVSAVTSMKVNDKNATAGPHVDPGQAIDGKATRSPHREDEGRQFAAR